MRRNSQKLVRLLNLSMQLLTPRYFFMKLEIKVEFGDKIIILY